MTSSEPHLADEVEMHRKLAVDLLNRVWELLDEPLRTRTQTDEMIHAAHASRYHWGVVGDPVNVARGEWQISRVYATLGRAEPALYHARRSLKVVQAHEIGDSDLAFAYEALARAQHLAGDPTERDASAERARVASNAIADKDDREVFLSELDTVPKG
jgi:hypothetical protein